VRTRCARLTHNLSPQTRRHPRPGRRRLGIATAISCRDLMPCCGVVLPVWREKILDESHFEHMDGWGSGRSSCPISSFLFHYCFIVRVL